MTTESITSPRLKKPDWLRVKFSAGENYFLTQKLIYTHKLHTICESGNCPNMKECWNAGTATFMILGNICTRSCGFCAVATGKPTVVDWNEPYRIAQSVKQMQLNHCVITSVDRDDLPDGGSAVWAMTIRAIRKISPCITLETLIPDFRGITENMECVFAEKPEVLSHNLETVKRLTKQVRVQAKYERSLEVLKKAKEYGLKTKSGIMLGLGETEKEIYETMDDLRNAKVDVLTLGQYLQPTKTHLPVVEFVHPDKFARYKEIGLAKKFTFVESSPLTRSSYHAKKHVF
ncbi:MAG: lipoyl synthase [Bacteroidota bacterium]